MKNIFENYATYLKLERQTTDNTIKRYVRILRSLKDHNQTDLLLLEQRHLENYIKKIQDYKINYQRLHITIIINFYKWLYDTKKISSNPAVFMRKLRPEKISPTILTGEEVVLLLNFPIKSWRDVRNKLFFNILYDTGLKINELLKLKVKQINKNERNIQINNRKIYINDLLYESLMIYIYQQNLTDYIFVNDKKKCLSIRQMQLLLKRYGELAGISQDRVTFHAFRHTAAMKLIEKKIPIRVIQEMMGYLRRENVDFYMKIKED